VAGEYGIEAVDDAVHVNRALREAGWLVVRDERGGELLDAGASRAFAVVDHQAAHVYVRDAGDVPPVAALCRGLAGVEQVLDHQAQAAVGLDHPRSGELVLVADARHWFSYDYWLDDAHAPDFARTVDIHRKPGYDPCELFSTASPVAVAGKLLRRKLGLRTLLDVVPLNPALVRGSHGRVEQPAAAQPVLITERDYRDHPDLLGCTRLRDVVLEHLFDG
jgi:Type I phosphodiesterase / nucleotide pyrophosphatase